jgi:hypothetical protein
MDNIPGTLTSAQPSSRVNPLRVFAAFSMLAVGVCILAFSMTGSIAANRDFISYWAAGQQLVQHGDPYDGEAILRREQSVGFVDNRPAFMRNPPYGLFLAFPLGFVGAKAGAVLWSLALVAALMGSIRMLWIMHGRPPGRLHLFGYCFPPTLACLLTGQVGIFILLGVVLFLYSHDSKPYVAGAALLLCMLKPHLFLPFGIVLISWIIAIKAYRILGGALGALVASVALSFFFDPAGWSHYAHMVRVSAIQNEFIPTMSLIFRLVIHRNFVWLQFGPALAGCVWGLWYYRTCRERWDWMDHGSLLLIASVLAAPYAWFSDEAILLPAVLAALYRVVDSGRSVLPLGLIGGIALIEVLASVKLTSPFYLWTAPAWLGWYLYAVRGTDAQSSNTYDPQLLAEGRKATL